MNIAPRLPYHRDARRSPRRARGFTLVEVLITVVVTLLAFTGLATMQMLSLRAATSSLQRSQAAALAYDLVDRLRLNRGGSGMTDSALGGAYDDRTLCKSGSRHAHDAQACAIDTLSTLTGTDSVTVDLRDWWTALTGSGLPHWYAGITRADDVFTVAVQWDDARAEDGGDTVATTKTSCLGSEMPTAMQEVCIVTQL